MMNSYIHRYYPVFTYFSSQLSKPLDWWTDKQVLDFGGNWGNVLRDPANTIRHENYYCIDISKDAIITGNRDFPNAHWYHYNRFNISYNHTGNRDEPFPIFETLFDVILIYSVFTSTSENEMCMTINNELLPLVRRGGILMNTYLSLDAPAVLSYFLRKKTNNSIDMITRTMKNIKEKDNFYLVGSNDNILTLMEELESHSDKEWVLSFYKDSKIQQLFPTCEIKEFRKESSRTDLIHHCMILQK